MPGTHATSPDRLPAVGILGFGRMGSGIALRLIARGFDVTVSDARPELRQAAESSGARWAVDAVELARETDVVITVLPGAPELESALGQAVFATMASGAFLLDFTSGDPRLSVRLSTLASLHGVRFLSAPMGGGPEDARAGSLRFFVDGDSGWVESNRAIFDALSRPDGVTWVGQEPGQAQLAKLAANLLWFGQAAAVTEALLLGQAMGLDVVRLRDALAASAGSSRFLTGSTDALFRGDYLESFELSRCLDELETIGALAADESIPFPISDAVTRLYREAADRFGSAEGELLAARLLEERAGRLLRADPDGA